MVAVGEAAYFMLHRYGALHVIGLLNGASACWHHLAIASYAIQIMPKEDKRTVYEAGALPALLKMM